MITTVIFDLDDTLFDEIILYTEDLGREFWKPSPRGFEELLQRLAARPDEAVYVADNEMKDFIAPNRLGLLPIRVRRPRGLYAGPSSQPDAAPKVRIGEIGALPGFLTSL